MSTTYVTYHRPVTRGELRDKLLENIECEVVTDNVGTTVSLLQVLEIDEYIVRSSENEDWSIFKYNPGVPFKFCQVCNNKGWYQYDDNHCKPCQWCCKHVLGWFDLGSNFKSFVPGGDNGVCKAGCGKLHRDL